MLQDHQGKFIPEMLSGGTGEGFNGEIAFDQNGRSTTEQAWDEKLGGGGRRQGKTIHMEGTICLMQECMGKQVFLHACVEFGQARV